MARVRAPRLTFFTLSESHRVTEGGKVDAIGIFNTFHVWATPAVREFSLTIGVTNLPAGTSEFNVYRRIGSKVQLIGNVRFTSEKVQQNGIGASRFVIKIGVFKDFELGLGLPGEGPRNIRWLPINIVRQPWVELPTGDALSRILSEPHTIKALRAEIVCEKCSARFTFEINVNPDAKRERGIRSFPEDGKFRCPKCRGIHHLKDIEGQLRSHIGKSIPGEAK